MLRRKKCKYCGKNVSVKNDFCSYCGNRIEKKEKREDWGLLGKEDSEPVQDFRIPSGFNMLINSLMKGLEKQFQNLDNELERESKSGKNFPKQDKQGISISISTFGDKPPQIKVKSFGNNINGVNSQEKSVKKNLPSKHFSKDNLRKLKKLPREEAETDIRRFSDSVVYEINLPDVESLDDISIVKLESSIEIKAVSKDKAYVKLIPVNLPIMGYNFLDGKLVLELGDK